MKRKARPLLVVGTGVALITIGASGCFTSGNLMVQRCPDGGYPLYLDPADECAPSAPDAGTQDAGPADAGTADGGTADGGR